MATSVQLSDLVLRRLKPTGQRVTITDHVERGLRARVSPKGEVSFILHARNATGKLQLVTLGRYPDLTLKAARELAARTRQALKGGEDVNGAKRTRRASIKGQETAPTLGEILVEYQEAFADRRSSWRPTGPRSTRGNARRCIEGVFSDLLDRPVNGLTAADLAGVMTQYSPKGRSKQPKVSSNGQVSRARAYLAPVLDWVAGRGKFAKIGAAREPRIEVVDIRSTFDPAREDPTITGERDRVLTEKELAAILPLLVHPAPKALKTHAKGEQDFRPVAMRFMLLTAARREEVVEMRRQDIDLVNGIWNKSKIKSTRGSPRRQALPLSEAALDVIKALPHIDTMASDDLLFPNTAGGKLGNWDRFQTMVERASGTSDWHRHDLRRTAATIMLALEIPVSTIDRIIGHTDPLKRENVSGAAGAYMRVTRVLRGRVDPQVAALNALAEALGEIERGVNIRFSESA
jgi:integrase